MRALVFLIVCAALALAGYNVAGTHTARGRHAEVETFLRRIADGAAAQAYDSATENYKRQFPWEDYQQFVENFHLVQYRPDSLQIENSSAGMDKASWRQGFSTVEIQGKAALRDDTRFLVTARLHHERGMWRMDYLYVTAPRPRAVTPPAGTNDAPQAEHPAGEPSRVGNAAPADASPSPPAFDTPPPAPPPGS